MPVELNESELYYCPAEWVIKTFGGVGKTARAIGRDKSSVSRWRRAKEEKGLDGEIPRTAQKKILEQAKRLGHDITAEDLILGRVIET